MPMPPDEQELVNSQSLEFLEALYSEFLTDPESVAPAWRKYFEQLDGRRRPLEKRPDRGPSFRRRSLFHPLADGNGAAAALPGLDVAVLQERVGVLVRNYRVRGHIIARIDPLRQPRPQPLELDPGFVGITDADLDRPISTESVPGPQVRTVREIIEQMRNTYCRSIGVQFMHIDDLACRQWLLERMESTENRIRLDRDQQFRILKRLTDAVVFEEVLQKKVPGAKSFSLEGAESLIPLLEMTLERAAGDGVEEVVLAMAHRGRLNVLANLMGKHPRQIFREFEDLDPELHIGRGDVKYHLGHSHDWLTPSGRKVHLSLCFNPSHLEFVNPVAVGRMRAKQDRFGDESRRRGLVVLIHGDASFAGEGVVQETLNLAELEGYTVGGTVHVVVNNQIGFTTSATEARSSTYATDVARMLQIPIFHVNGEDPEAVAQVIRLGMDFRRDFQRDVVIDMYCYRRHGHNEGDEPAFTQPLLYRTIAGRKSVRAGYLEHLLKLGGIPPEEAQRVADDRREHLERELSAARSDDYRLPAAALQGVWEAYRGGPESDVPDVDTGVPVERLSELLERLTVLPEDFHPHRKIEWGLARRREMAAGEQPLDWSAGEALAFATLATEGVRVRMSGQDSERGTFSQRHAVLHDVEDGHTYMPLEHLAGNQAPVEIYNSPLSETGVLGFEYGYSLDTPDGLVLWEAQFGDFVNAAQVIVDQFIASAEDKWNRLSGIVLLLPHGYEGQGPEHSSARLERFLMLAAECNIQVVWPTTPAQYFHALRRQVLRPWRKPLVVMTPKSLLRHRRAVSSLDDLATGRFRRVLPDVRGEDAPAAGRILLCTGKIYYELESQREALGRDDVAIVRIEQLYPFPTEELRQALAAYADETPAVWVQEEPANMGAWRFVRERSGEKLFGRLPLSAVTRPPSASPATGSKNSHALEQESLLGEAFGGG
ncbi:MAG TPA: 2-oxoglutarate dehydrogenase E1 component [Planctomycetaceae bacterium]|nr:2-oxoglutarate dehydrogenase E1 component [Planctomycetaceae bacterium]